MAFRPWRALAIFCFFFVVGLAGGTASAGPWSATLYGGPTTQRVFTQIVGDGQFNVSGGLVGLAVDRRLVRLGWGISVGAEGQITQDFGEHTFNTFALGLGLRFDEFPWSDSVPMSIGIYSGPSYATDPPAELYVPNRRQIPFLNYFGLEVAVAIPHHERLWDAVMRIYHRSGAWGLYSINADEGSMIGVGLRARF